MSKALHEPLLWVFLKLVFLSFHFESERHLVPDVPDKFSLFLLFLFSSFISAYFCGLRIELYIYHSKKNGRDCYCSETRQYTCDATHPFSENSKWCATTLECGVHFLFFVPAISEWADLSPTCGCVGVCVVFYSCPPFTAVYFFFFFLFFPSFFFFYNPINNNILSAESLCSFVGRRGR